MLLQLSHSPLHSTPSCIPLPPTFPAFSSHPWVIHVSSLASTFPILFLTSPCLFCTYCLCFLFPVPFSPFPPPFIPLCPTHPFPPAFPYLGSCPWVIYISSLASTFPILFLTSPCLSSTYHLCYLFCVPFTPLSLPTPLLITLHVISISVILFLL